MFVTLEGLPEDCRLPQITCKLLQITERRPQITCNYCRSLSKDRRLHVNYRRLLREDRRSLVTTADHCQKTADHN